MRMIRTSDNATQTTPTLLKAEALGTQSTPLPDFVCNDTDDVFCDAPESAEPPDGTEDGEPHLLRGRVRTALAAAACVVAGAIVSGLVAKTTMSLAHRRDAQKRRSEWFPPGVPTPGFRGDMSSSLYP